jgi:hypothetical protein
MKRSLGTFCVIILMVMMSAAVVAAGPNEVAADTRNPDYYSLVKKLKSNDTNIDFMALRLSYTKTKDYMPYGSDASAKDAAFGALNKKNFAEAIRQGEIGLEKNYADPDIHLVCMIANRESGNSVKSAFHNAVLKGLVGSLYASGNGTTPEDAIVVISVAEEYFLLNANGLKTIKSSSMTANGHHYDKMDVEDRKTAEKMVIYFNIDIPYGTLEKSLKKE